MYTGILFQVEAAVTHTHLKEFPKKILNDHWIIEWFGVLLVGIRIRNMLLILGGNFIIIVAFIFMHVEVQEKIEIEKYRVNI